MALAELLRVLEHDTEAEIRAIAAAGAGDAARIEADAARARGDRVAGAIAACTAGCSAASDTELAALDRRTRAAVLAARAAMLARIREAVRGELPALVTGDPALGRTLIAAALACVGDGQGTLRCAPVLAEAARAAAPPAIGVEVDPAVATGAVVELVSGTRIDATLDALLDRAWPALSCEALALERTR